jgi:hypothetical protein
MGEVFMIKDTWIVIVTAILSIATVPQAKECHFPSLKGAYLGQKPPGMEPIVFAPGIVSTGMLVRDVAMTPEGDELYFSAVLGNYAFTTIFCTRLLNGRWTEPATLPFMADLRYGYIEPALSPDGEMAGSMYP